MAKHHPDLIMCRKQPGIAIGRLCEKCDGKCVICDSYVRPSTLVRICDECKSLVYPNVANILVTGNCSRWQRVLNSWQTGSITCRQLIPLSPPLYVYTGNYGSYEGRCVICGGPGISDAYYCRECTQEEKDRDGCPKIVNLGSSKTDLFYERKKYGFKRR